MKPGSKVNTPCSLVRAEISRASGPMVPETAFSEVVFPVARFLSSYFVLMRCSDGDVCGFVYDPAALHGRTSESREPILKPRKPARCSRTGTYAHSSARTELKGARTLPISAHSARRSECSANSRVRFSPPPSHTSCGIYRRGRRYPRFSACRYRTDGNWSKLRPADP